MLVFPGEACSKGRSHLIDPKQYTVGSSILALPDSKALPDSSQVKPTVTDSDLGISECPCPKYFIIHL